MSLLLSGQGLSKAFGHQTLFSGIDIVLHKGDHVGLIGPNGSGKSTLLRILSGLAEADSGRIFLPKNTRVGFLAQEDTFTKTIQLSTICLPDLMKFPMLKSRP